MPLTLTQAERERVKIHLGYMNVSMAASLTFGFPRPVQTMFLVEDAMSFLNDDGVLRVRQLIAILDKIECRLIETVDFLIAENAGDTKINLDAPGMIEREYVRWSMRLADALGVPPYPFSKRFMGGGAGGIGNIKVHS